MPASSSWRRSPACIGHIGTCGGRCEQSRNKIDDYICDMELASAVSLIEKGVQPNPSQQWADLGAGSGLFTNALLKIAGPDSLIYAIDKDSTGLKEQPGIIKKINLDFTNGLGELTNLDGVLMANSLHYVRDKISLFRKLTRHLKPGGRFIIVEYDTDQANTWVPYPMSFNTLSAFITANKIGTITKIGEARSNYQRAGMYSALISLLAS